MLLRHAAPIVLSFFILTAANSSYATVLSFSFIGTIQLANEIPGVSVGNSFTGSIVYDTDTPEFSQNPVLPETTYRSTDPASPNLISVTVGGTTFSSSTPTSIFLVVTDSNEFSVEGAQLLFSIGDSNFPNDVLPSSLELTSGFPDNLVDFGSPGSDGFEGRIASLQEVPEPSTLALLALGAVGLLFARRRLASSTVHG